MNLANCPNCGKLFVRNAWGICPNCIKETEQQFQRCYNYLRENRRSTLTELSEATGVPVRQITRFIKEGRISIADAPNMAYDCEACGAPIREGHLCENCRKRLSREVSHLQEDEKRRHDALHRETSAYLINEKDKGSK